MSDTLDKIFKVNRRWLYLILILSVAIPYNFPIGIPLKISPATRELYDYIENLPDGSVVVIDATVSMAIYGESGPQEIVVAQHLFNRPDLKLIFISVEPEGPIFTATALRDVDKGDKKYGEDWVELGYISGWETGMAAFLSDIRSVYSIDYYGTAIDELSILDNVRDGNDIDLFILITSVELGAHLRQWVASWDVSMGVLTTAGWFVGFLPYYYSGQVEAGLLNGLRGAAEYELLLSKPGKAIARMDANSMVHLAIIAFIIIGNIGFLYEKNRREEN